MNERIKELWMQAGIYDGREGLYWFSQEQLEKFAELIVEECADVALQEEHEPSDCILGHFGLKR